MIPGKKMGYNYHFSNDFGFKVSRRFSENPPKKKQEKGLPLLYRSVRRPLYWGRGHLAFISKPPSLSKLLL